MKHKCPKCQTIIEVVDIEVHITGLLKALKGMEKRMSKELDDLTARVTANNDLIESALTLIAGLRQAIIDAGTDPAKLKALTDSLQAEDDKLAAAVVANTPAP